MKGLELSRSFYREYGQPMLEKEFPDLLPFLAVGFVGSGSDRYGYDDEVSEDHDFEAGFCVFLPDESVIDRRKAFLLERAYAKLPKEYCGVSRSLLSPVGGNRNGVFRTADFYNTAVGSPDGVLTVEQWLHLPDFALAEAINGEVFYDAFGEFSAIRKTLLHMPRKVQLKRLAGNLLLMAQAGQYNFLRCLKHGEPQAAQLAANEFVTAALKVVFLLNDRYLPYYKWSFRALRELDGTENLYPLFSALLMGNNTEQKYREIEQIAEKVIALLRQEGYSDAESGDLERHAYAVNSKIEDATVRNMHILTAV